MNTYTYRHDNDTVRVSIALSSYVSIRAYAGAQLGRVNVVLERARMGPCDTCAPACFHSRCMLSPGVPHAGAFGCGGFVHRIWPHEHGCVVGGNDNARQHGLQVYVYRLCVVCMLTRFLLSVPHDRYDVASRESYVASRQRARQHWSRHLP